MRILSSGLNTHKAVVTSDALGSWGCGVRSGVGPPKETPSESGATMQLW